MKGWLSGLNIKIETKKSGRFKFREVMLVVIIYFENITTNPILSKQVLLIFYDKKCKR